MASCVSTPTSTQYATTVVNSVATSFSNSVTSFAGAVSTVVTTVCQSGLGDQGPACETRTSLSTVPGETNTVQVPVIATVSVTQSSPTATLFGTSCNAASSQNFSSPNSFSTNTSQSSVLQSATPTSNGSTAASTSSPPPTGTSTASSTDASSFTSDSETTLVGTSSTTLPGGSVEVVPFTSTATLVVTLAASPQIANTSSSSSSNVGPIAAGIAGGVIALAAMILLINCLVRRRRKRVTYDAEEDIMTPPPVRLRRNREKEPALDAEPQAYPYNPLGYSPSTPSTSSPSTVPTPDAKGKSGYFAVPTVSPRAGVPAPLRRRTTSATSPTALMQFSQMLTPPVPPIPVDARTASSSAGSSSRPQQVKAAYPERRVVMNPEQSTSQLARPPLAAASLMPRRFSGQQEYAVVGSSAGFQPPIVHQDAGRIATAPSSKEQDVGAVRRAGDEGDAPPPAYSA